MLAQPYLNQSTGFALLRHLKIQDPVQSSKFCDVWISPRKIMLRRTLANMTMFLAIDLCQYHAVVARQNPCETEYSLHLIACKRELNIEIGRFDSRCSGCTVAGLGSLHAFAYAGGNRKRCLAGSAEHHQAGSP